MSRYALIVAAGTGSRMRTDVPKQFLELARKPVLMHTIERFSRFDKSIGIIIVLPEANLGYWEKLQAEFSFSVPHSVVAGGSSRFYSVKNGLQLVEDNSLVAIHDGVRPLVSTDTIKRCFEGAEKFGNAVPVVSPADSLRMITEQGNIPVNRLYLRIIQTPQVFDARLIKKAYLQDYNPDFTDDATLLEKTGESIHLVEGNRENIKITNPEDMMIAEALLNSAF
jgi:2-C-methyl-D-erythritol 4-phosphate cytidylyltransferase